MYRAYKWLSYSGSLEVPLSADNHFSQDKHKLNVSRSFTLRFVHLTLRSQPCMTSAYSWLSSSAAAGFGCLSWCLLPFVSGHSLWSLVNMPGWAGKLLLPYFLCVLRDTHPDLIPLSCLSLSPPKLSTPRSWKLFSGLSANHSPLSDEDDDVALLSVEMEPGEIIICLASEWRLAGGLVVKVCLAGHLWGSFPSSLPGFCDTDGDAAILSLSVETPLSPPGQRHVGVVSTNLQWALKHLVAKPVVERRKTVLGEI